MKRREKQNSGQIGAMVMLFSIGVLTGLVVMYCLDGIFEEFGFLFALAIKLILFLVAYFVQLIIHELGHLVAGLISGYGFGSFRVGSLMFVKEQGKIKIKKHSVAGTGGQCLMTPPPIVEGKYPVLLYNLGGVLMNLVTLPIFALLIVFCSSLPWVYAICVLMLLSGLIVALTNGIPLKLGMVNNDGSNARELYKNEEAMRVFHNQFMTVEQITNGKRLRDMPSDWFFMPSEAGLKNSITVSGAVFRENRLMDEGKYEEALELINYLLNSETALIGLHRSLLICDKIVIALLLGDENTDIYAFYMDKQFEVFMKQMKNNISVVRTQYAYALLYKKNKVEALNLKSSFEKCALTHPYAPDVESERELLALIDKKAEE